MTITPLPSLDRTSPTFRADLDTFFLTQLPNFSTQIDAVVVEINAKASAAAGSAAAANDSKTAAAGSATAAASSATAAGESKSAAAGSASAASSSATAANDSKVAAAGSATSANDSKVAAAGSATAANTAKVAAEAARDQAQQIVLGDIHGTAPTLFRNNAENDERFLGATHLPNGTSLATLLTNGRYAIDSGAVDVPLGFVGPVLVEVSSNVFEGVTWFTQRVTSRSAAGTAKMAWRSGIVYSNGTDILPWNVGAVEDSDSSFKALTVSALRESVLTVTGASGAASLDFGSWAGYDFTLNGNLTLNIPYLSLPDNVEITRIVRLRAHATTAFTVTFAGVAFTSVLKWATEGGVVVPSPAPGTFVELVITGRKSSATAIQWILGKGRSDGS
jgi:hypothetical protein